MHLHPRCNRNIRYTIDMKFYHAFKIHTWLQVSETIRPTPQGSMFGEQLGILNIYNSWRWSSDAQQAATNPSQRPSWTTIAMQFEDRGRPYLLTLDNNFMAVLGKSWPQLYIQNILVIWGWLCGFTWFYVAWRALPWSERTTYIQSRNWATGQGFSARSAALSKTLKPQWWSSGAASRCCYSSLHFDWANCMKYHLLFPYQIVQQVRCLSSDPNSVHQEQAFWQASGPHKHSSYNDSFCSYTINPLANCKAQQNQNIGHVIKRNWIFTIINDSLWRTCIFLRQKKNCPESQLPVANNYLELQQCLAPGGIPQTDHTRPNDSYAILVPRELLVITVGWIPEWSL